MRVAVIGCGYWGENLVRNMAELGALAAVADANPASARAMADRHGVSVRSVEELWADSGIEGVVIASSASTHAKLANAALEAGKHVFVEKPLALNVTEAEALAALASAKGRVLMVGHLLHYHPAYLAMAAQVRAGRVGDVRYVQSHRLSFGKIRQEENVIWSFAPHDISMLLGLVGEMPARLTTHTTATVSRDIADIAMLHLEFPGGVKGHIMASWLHPVKEHKLTIIGERGMLVFDDTQPWESKLMFYAHQVHMAGSAPEAVKGNAEAIALEPCEPLKEECAHFLRMLENPALTLRTDGAEAVRVLRVLEMAEASAASGKTVENAVNAASAWYAHPSAIIDEGCSIGAGTKIWHFSHILSGTHLGRNVVIGQNVMIGPQVTVGDGCKIQNNVSLYKGVQLEEGVFCGPSCVFTNVNTPRAGIERKDEFLPTPVEKGATIGANATIICGNRLGAYCLIGAGAVVTKDVKPHALMVGNPARQIGWVSHAGERLGEDMICPREGRKYCVDAEGYLEETGEVRRGAGQKTSAAA